MNHATHAGEDKLVLTYADVTDVFAQRPQRVGCPHHQESRELCLVRKIVSLLFAPFACSYTAAVDGCRLHQNEKQGAKITVLQPGSFLQTTHPAPLQPHNHRRKSNIEQWTKQCTAECKPLLAHFWPLSDRGLVELVEFGNLQLMPLELSEVTRPGVRSLLLVAGLLKELKIANARPRVTEAIQLPLVQGDVNWQTTLAIEEVHMNVTAFLAREPDTSCSRFTRMKRAAPAAPGACSPEAGAMALRVLVTGSTGYVGRFLLPSLEKDGHHVVGVSRSSPVKMDLCNSTDCEAVLREVKPDVIVHTAALSSPAKCEEDEALTRIYNVPRLFAEKAKEVNENVRFIFLSTDQVHDGKGRLVGESGDVQPVNVYGKSKLEMETVVQQVFDRYAIFRMSFVFGPEMEGAHSTFLQFALDKIRSCIYIDDVIDALRLAVKGHIEGIVNLGGPEALSRLDFCRIVAKHFGINESIVQGSLYHLPTPSPADISMNIKLLESAMGRLPRSLDEALKIMDPKL
eukprot:s113_g20.t2